MSEKLSISSHFAMTDSQKPSATASDSILFSKIYQYGNNVNHYLSTKHCHAYTRSDYLIY